MRRKKGLHGPKMSHGPSRTHGPLKRGSAMLTECILKPVGGCDHNGMSFRSPVDSSAPWEDGSLRECFNIPFKPFHYFLVTHLKARYSVTLVPAVKLIGECM